VCLNAYNKESVPFSELEVANCADGSGSVVYTVDYCGVMDFGLFAWLPTR